jgi:hypothetical protein
MDKLVIVEQKKLIKDVVKQFMGFWKKQEFGDAYKKTALTYQKSHDVNDLKTIICYRINTSIPMGIYFITPCVADCHVTVNTNFGKFAIRIRLMKELAAFVPSEEGTWMISPPSIKRIKN